MLPKLFPLENQYASSVEKFIPSEATGVFEIAERDRAIWNLAKKHLKVRNNDEHTLYAYGLAKAITETEPDSNAEVVLAAILLHDTGWSRVPEELVLSAISPDGGDRELVLWHERESVSIAKEILTKLNQPDSFIDQVVDIISTHDSMKEAKSLDDAIVKDADKLWRITPHGIDTVMDWFGLNRHTANLLCSWRVHDYLHTPAAKNMALAFSAVASMDASVERTELG